MMADKLSASIPSISPKRPIRLLIVDDSPLIRNLLMAMLADVLDIQVIGQATNGQEAIRMTMRQQPDVITMDIRMPGMDGLEATRQIMRIRPTPIVVLSSAVYAEDYHIAFDAISAGALTVIEKPKGLGAGDYQGVRSELISAIRLMSDVKLVARRDHLSRPDGIGPTTAILHAYFTRSVQIIAIAASTGGPAALMRIISDLPGDFVIPIVVVQHILPAFNQAFVDWLGSKTSLQVKIAEEGDAPSPGKIFVAPTGVHLTITPERTIHLDHSDPIRGQRPSATRLFETVARAYRSNAVGIILTGMGEDGVDGLEMLAKAGSHIIAQGEKDAVIFGMPKAAIQRGIVDEVLTQDQIIVRLMKFHRHMQPQAAAKI